MMANNIEIIDEEEATDVDLIIDDGGTEKDSEQIKPGLGELVILRKVEDEAEMIDVGIDDASASITVDISSESEDERQSTGKTNSSQHPEQKEEWDNREKSAKPTSSKPAGTPIVPRSLDISQEPSARKGIKRRSNGLEPEDEWDYQGKSPKLVFPSDEFKERQVKNLKEKHRRIGMVDLFMKLQGLLITSSENLWSKTLILERTTSCIEEMKKVGNQLRIDIDRLMSENCRLRYKYLKLMKAKEPSAPLAFPDILFTDSTTPGKKSRRKSESSLNGGLDDFELVPLFAFDSSSQSSGSGTINTIPSSNKSQASSLICRRLSDGSVGLEINQDNAPGPSRITRTVSVDGGSTSQIKKLGSGIYKISKVQSVLNKSKTTQNGIRVVKGGSTKVESPPPSIVIPSSSRKFSDDYGVNIETIELSSSDDEL